MSSESRSQSDESGPWVASTNHRGPNRVLHPERSCRHLETAVTVRPASPEEQSELPVCKECTESTTGNGGGDWSWYRAAREVGRDGD